MEIETGTKIILTCPRESDPDPYNSVGWVGTVVEIQVATEQDEEASGALIWEDETYYTVKWDNGYQSYVYPESGDEVVACGTT